MRKTRRAYASTLAYTERRNISFEEHIMTPIAQPALRRSFVWLGFGLCVLGIALSIAQFGLKMLFVPWYIPALSTLGAILALIAFVDRRTIFRGAALAVMVAFAALEWYFIGVFLKLPEYKGPATAGSPMPSFQTALADGTPFTEKDLATGQTTVLTFFRGNW
jgi:hypothetical protein